MFAIPQDFFDYTPPSRKTIMGPLLDTLYNDTKARVETLLNFDNPDSLVTLSTDGWEAPGGIHIRNYVIVADKVTFFHTATSNGTVRPTADNIAEETIAVMKDLGPQNVAGIANDNAAAETTAWDRIRDQFPNTLANGCTTHAGALLFKDACKHKWAQALVDNATFIAKYFRNHQYLTAEVIRRTILQHKSAYVVILHGATRFAGFYYTAKRLVFLRPILREIVHSGPFEERKFKDADKITALINNTTFWANLHKLRVFMKPLKCFIKLMDHDCHCAHHEYPGELFILSLPLSCLASY